MSSKYTNLYRIFFLLSDLIALNLVFILLLSRIDIAYDVEMKTFIVLNLVSNIFWLMSSYLTAAYIIYKDVNLRLLSKRTAISLTMFCFGLLFFTFLAKYDLDLLFVICIVSGFGVYLLISRLVLISYVLYTRTNRKFYNNVVIIGFNETSQSLAGLFYSSQSNLRFRGYFDDIDEENLKQVYPILGNIGNCLNYAIDHHISEIYCTLSPESSTELYGIAEEAEKHFIRFRFVPDLSKFIGRKVHVDFIDDMPILSLRSEPMEYKTAQIKKRVFDLIMSSVILLFLLSWLLPILALLIKLDSKGPVFFSQKRTGRNNSEFSCLKLRSLKPVKNSNEATIQVTQNDGRLTRVGRFLRKTNLDELPQFFNVFLGHMSIVGARPHMLKHTVDFANLEEAYMIRLLSKPGVTGWAQINGFRGEIKKPNQLKKRVEYDIWYIENWNLLLDIKIIFLTIYVTIKGDQNAY
jgi:putative colanic acid biosynthesis UDP-glucose lipid carrier transferase